MNQRGEFYSHQEIPAGQEIFLPSNVALTILYGRHATAEDIGDIGEFRRIIRSANIVIPEAFGWREHHLKDFKNVVSGHTDDYTDFKKSLGIKYLDHDKILLSALFASHVKIEIVDITNDDPITIAIRKYHNDKIGLPIKSTYDDTLQAIDTQFQDEAHLQLQRENHILRELGPKLMSLITPNPKLYKAARVDVVMLLGREHRRVFDILHQLVLPGNHGLPNVASIDLSTGPEIQEVAIKNMYKGYPLPEGEQKERLLAEVIVKGEFLAIYKRDGVKIDPYFLTQLVKALTDEELRDVYESMDLEKNIFYDTDVVLKIKQLVNEHITSGK